MRRSRRASNTGDGLTHRSGDARALYVAVFVSLVLVFFRPQEMMPALKVLRPIQACTIAIFALWLWYQPKTVLSDPLFRWQLFLLGVMVIGLPNVTNHYWWLYTITDYVSALIVFSLGLAAVARFGAYRCQLLRLMLLGFLFISCWVLTHAGQGPPNSWIYDENDAAAALIVGLCLASAMWIEASVTLWRGLAILTGAACLSGIIVTMSRGGFLGLVAAVGVISLFYGRLLRSTLLVALVAIVALPLVPDRYWNEVRSIGDDTRRVGDVTLEMERIYTWRRGWDMFLDNPIIGVGAGNFPWKISSYEVSTKGIQQRGERRMIGGRVAHSIYFTLLPELGLLGAVGYFACLGIAFRRARTALKSTDQSDEGRSLRIVARFIGPAIVGYSVAGIFVSVLWYPPLWLFVGLGILLGSPRPEASPESNVRRIARPVRTARSGRTRRNTSG